MMHQKISFIFKGKKVSVDECQNIRNPSLVLPMENYGTVDESFHLGFHICKMGECL